MSKKFYLIIKGHDIVGHVTKEDDLILWDEDANKLEQKDVEDIENAIEFFGEHITKICDPKSYRWKRGQKLNKEYLFSVEQGLFILEYIPN